MLYRSVMFPLLVFAYQRQIGTRTSFRFMEERVMGIYTQQYFMVVRTADFICSCCPLG
jgi:hypothetical protein